MLSTYAQKNGESFAQQVAKQTCGSRLLTRVRGVASLSFVLTVAVGCSGEDQSIAEHINGHEAPYATLAMYKVGRGSLEHEETKEPSKYGEDECKEPPPSSTATATSQSDWQERLREAIKTARAADDYQDLKAKVLRRMRGELHGLPGRFGHGGQLGFWSSRERGEELVKLGPSALPLIVDLLFVDLLLEMPDFKQVCDREKGERIKALFRGLHGLAKIKTHWNDIQAGDVVALELDLFEHSADPSVRYIVALTILGRAYELPVASEALDRIAQSLHKALMDQSEEAKSIHNTILDTMVELSARSPQTVRSLVAEDVLFVLKNSSYSLDLREDCVYTIASTGLLPKSDAIREFDDLRKSLEHTNAPSLKQAIDLKLKKLRGP